MLSMLSAYRTSRSRTRLLPPPDVGQEIQLKLSAYTLTTLLSAKRNCLTLQGAI